MVALVFVGKIFYVPFNKLRCQHLFKLVHLNCSNLQLVMLYYSLQFKFILLLISRSVATITTLSDL